MQQRTLNADGIQHSFAEKDLGKCWRTRLGTLVSTAHRGGQSHSGLYEQACSQQDKGSLYSEEEKRSLFLVSRPHLEFQVQL